MDVNRIKREVNVSEQSVEFAHSISHHQSFSSLKEDNSLNIDKFRHNLKINIISVQNNTIIFDLIGVNAAFANALRRILLAEVPTIAIEKVNIYQNTSVMPDEVLAHRLGLVPINIDPHLLNFVHENENNENTEENTIVFVLHIQGKANVKQKVKDPQSATRYYTNGEVNSDHMVWIPQGEQKEVFKNNNIPKPLYANIPITKLGHDEEIEIEMLCEKGIGRTHAKWSPVSTATYRLLPNIHVEPILKNDDAQELKNLCPADVFDIEDLGHNNCQIKVARPRSCTMCRECITKPVFKDQIKLGRIRDHFIFEVESVGMYKPVNLINEALNVLNNKATTLLQQLYTPESDEIKSDDNADDDANDVKE